MTSNILTKPIHKVFAPLFWILDESLPKDEEPTLENFKNCYVNKCKKKEPPGWLEKRLLLEFLGGLGILGGGAFWLYGKFKDSTFWKVAGGVCAIGGIGSGGTGFIKNWQLKIGELLKLNPKKPGSALSEQQPAPIQTSSSPPGTSLMIVSSDGNEMKEGPESLDDFNFEVLQEPSLIQQLSNITKKFADKSIDEVYDFFRDHPRLQFLASVLPGGVQVILAIEAAKAFKEGKFTFEGIDPETGGSRQYNYSDNKDKLFKAFCQELEVNENASKEEIKAAYRKAARTYHPDRNPGDLVALEKFKKAATAYEFIREYQGWS